MTCFPFYADPGHGWLKVTRAQLTRAGLSETDFSVCSYKRGETFYLEQDSDASLFITAWTKKTGKSYSFKQYHGNKSSRIRNYEGIR